MRRLTLLTLYLVLLAGTTAGLAQQPVRVRVGDHPGHGRIVFDWRTPPTYWLEQVGDLVVLRFAETAAVDLAGAARPPRNVTGVTQGSDGIEIAIRPGARMEHARLGPRVVVDVFDPAASRPKPVTAPAAAQPGPGEPDAVARRPSTAQQRRSPSLPVPAADQATAAAVVSGRLLAMPGGGAPAGPVSELHPGLPEPATPLARLDGPAANLPTPHLNGAGPTLMPPPDTTARAGLPVRVLRPPGRGPILALPFGAETGAALLRRNGDLLAVFDQARLIDLAALHNDPVFGSTTTMALPGGVALQLPLPASVTLRARREGTGWLLEAVGPAWAGDPAQPAGRGLQLETDPATPPSLIFRVAQPGAVLTLADPESGLPLLLGTVRQGGQAIPVGRRLPELDLPATLLGAAVLARADSVTLRAGRDRFTVGSAGGTGLALDAALAQDPDAAGMTRLFDLPGLPAARLLDRLRLQQHGIAAAAPLARLPQRRAAAEALLALGLPHEAQAMLELARLEDPGAAADRPLAALGAAAALLAGRPETAALLDPTLAGSDELTLWRAMLAAMRGEARAAAPSLAATLPLLLDYPEGLRARLLPAAALALAEAGNGAALERLLGAAGPGLEPALPRAVLAESQGRVEDALAGYATAAGSRDRRTRAFGVRRGIELQLAAGRLEPLDAARALDRALFAWRGDEDELTARLRVAELWGRAGDAAASFAVLRDSETLFPDHAAVMRPPMQTAFAAALGSQPPLAAAALFDAYPDLLPGDARGEAAVLTLADRLTALDLTDRAAGLVRQAVDRAPDGEGRAVLGLRLAALRLAEDDAQGALAALEASATRDLPERLMMERGIAAARAEARRGRLPVAVAILRAQGPPGLEPLAELLVDAQDWAGAADALGAHILRAVPPAPTVLEDDAQRLLVRQAAMLALAGNEAALAALRSRYAERLRDGALHGAFTLLSGDPLRGLGDLPRLQRELQLFRGAPSRLEALRAGAPTTR